MGFSLPEIKASAVKVQRYYIDLTTSEIIHQKSDFIEKLTHDCFVVQLPRIEARQQTRLDKLLSVFEQAHFVDAERMIKEYKQPIDEDNIKNMTDILHYVGTDPTEKKQIAAEQEAWRTVEAMWQEKSDELQGVIREQAKTLEEQAKLIEELKRKLGEK